MDTRLEAISVKALLALSDQTEGDFPALEELDLTREFGSWSGRQESGTWQTARARVRTHTVSSLWEAGGRLKAATGRSLNETVAKASEKGTIGKGPIPAMRPFVRTHLSSTLSYRTLPDLESRSKYQPFRDLYGRPRVHTSHRARMIKTAACVSSTFVPFHMELTAAFGLSHSPL